MEITIKGANISKNGLFLKLSIENLCKLFENLRIRDGQGTGWDGKIGPRSGTYFEFWYKF